MIKILVISYNFPPEGGPAVQRISKFVKYLAQLGAEVFVLTSKHPIKVKDQSLLNELPSSLKKFYVLDLFSFLPGEIRKILKRKNIPDKHVSWNKKAIKQAKKIINENSINIVLTTSPPHSVHLIGLELKKKLNIKWITDFRDEWTSDPVFNHSHKNKIVSIEKEVVNSCDTLITVTRKAVENFSRYNPVLYLIRNGYDVDDFLHVRNFSTKKNKKLTIVYTGRLTKKSSPESFFNKLLLLIQNSPKLIDKLEVKIIGSMDNSHWIKDSPELEKIVKFYPYVPHEKSIEELCKADVLLLLASNNKNSEVFTGKVFEYIYLKKPILAIFNYEGELSDFLKSYGNIYLGVSTKENSIKDAIHELILNWENGNINKPVDKNFIQEFNRQNQSEKLFEICQNLLKDKNE
jgi:glycosyltransferase involved in cell wall biosynthesis